MPKGVAQPQPFPPLDSASHLRRPIAPMSDPPQPKTILILSANPRGTDPLRLDEEVREIAAAIERSRHRDQFVIQHQLAARPRDVQRAMLGYKPQIVHFCGHGAGNAGLIADSHAPNHAATAPPRRATRSTGIARGDDEPGVAVLRGAIE
ncbi:MAG: hypothetical protein HC881_13380 [Leptolyngbyaceae cyanobacterium SL_7_1]|nr:hypothetical protein [Leptolyngbyaceae cyanobacterium SL_7_1]